jgi:aspartate aminotransferase-like enzyme
MQIVMDLEEQYKVMVCPNGGAERELIFRISHMGEMDKAYTDILIDALFDYYKMKRV